MVDFIKMIAGTLLFFIFISGGLWIIEDNVSSGNFRDDPELENQTTLLSSTASTLNKSYSMTRNQYDDMLESDVEEETSALDFMINNGFSAIIRVVDTFKILDNVIQDIAKHLHIPPFFIDAAVILIFATITITLIYMMFRFQPR
jgi:hypothetical protein